MNNTNVVIHRGRTNVIALGLGRDVSGEVFTSQIRAEKSVYSGLLGTFEVAFATDGTDGELLLTLDDSDTIYIAKTYGYMDLQVVSNGEPYSVFFEPLPVIFKGVVTNSSENPDPPTGDGQPFATLEVTGNAIFHSDVQVDGMLRMDLAPVGDSDVVNKAYVDSVVGGGDMLPDGGVPGQILAFAPPEVPETTEWIDSPPAVDDALLARSLKIDANDPVNFTNMLLGAPDMARRLTSMDADIAEAGNSGGGATQPFDELEVTGLSVLKGGLNVENAGNFALYVTDTQAGFSGGVNIDGDLNTFAGLRVSGYAELAGDVSVGGNHGVGGELSAQGMTHLADLIVHGQGKMWADPTEADDLVNKAYVDNAAGGGGVAEPGKVLWFDTYSEMANAYGMQGTIAYCVEGMPNLSDQQYFMYSEYATGAGADNPWVPIDALNSFYVTDWSVSGNPSTLVFPSGSLTIDNEYSTATVEFPSKADFDAQEARIVALEARIAALEAGG